MLKNENLQMFETGRQHWLGVFRTVVIQSSNSSHHFAASAKLFKFFFANVMYMSMIIIGPIQSENLMSWICLSDPTHLDLESASNNHDPTHLDLKNTDNNKSYGPVRQAFTNCSYN